MAFTKAEIDWVQLENQSGSPVSLRCGVTAFDTVKGSRHFRMSFTGPQLSGYINSGNKEATLTGLIMSELAKRHAEWVAEPSRSTTQEPIPPDITTL